MKTHLIVALAANALVWTTGVTYVVTNGALPWWVLYLLCGSMYAILILARNPTAFIGHTNPAWESMLHYVGVTLGWLPLIAYSGHQGVLNVLRTSDEDLAFEAHLSEMIGNQQRDGRDDS